MTRKANWLQQKEQEQGLETKTERLMQALIETEAKVHLAKEGFLTEVLPRSWANKKRWQNSPIFYHWRGKSWNYNSLKNTEGILWKRC